MNDQSNDITREKIKRILKIYVRLFSIPLVMLLGILAGIAMVCLIDFLVTKNPDLRNTFYTASMALGAAIILSLVKDLIQNLPNFYSYVFAKDNQKSWEAFLKAFGAIFFASFALMLSIRSVAEFTPSKKPIALNLDLAFYQSNNPSPIDTEKSLLTMYILYSRDAGISSMGNLREDRSVWPDELYEEQRESLLKALKSCGEARENPAIVQVRGFASAGLAESAVKENLEYAYKKVENDDEKFSKAFNLYIAEKRAENLVTKIKEMIGDKKKHRHIFMQMEKLPGNGD